LGTWSVLLSLNNYRPHEALGQKPPAKFYSKSKRDHIEKPKEPEYDDSFIVRRVNSNGTIKFKGKKIFISEVLYGQPVGLKKIDSNILTIQYSFYQLGKIDLKKNKILRKV
jgi:putative transposase